MPLHNPSSATVSPITANTTYGSTVASSVASVPLVNANSGRKGLTIWNQSTANLYIELGSIASTNAFAVKINSYGYYELPFNYIGTISGIWDAVNGSAFVREFVDAAN